HDGPVSCTGKPGDFNNFAQAAAIGSTERQLAHSTLSAVDLSTSGGFPPEPSSFTPAPLKSLPRVSVIAGTPCELVTLSPGFIAAPDRPRIAASRRAWAAWSGAYSSVVRASCSAALPPFSDLVTPCSTWSQLRVVWALPAGAPPLRTCTRTSEAGALSPLSRAATA